jgi:hypothetical protein
MLRWVSIIGSSIALALFGASGFGATAYEGCPDRIPMAAMAITKMDTFFLALQPSCAMFYNAFAGWTLLCGLCLTVLLLIAHLIMAFRKYATWWFITLLIVPPLCFFCGLSYALSWSGDTFAITALTMSISCSLAGLPNLLFGIIGLRPTRAAGRASLPGAGAVPVSPLSEPSEQQQS